jgi:membrane-associated protease RseP (regulator of RpoE activity)
MHWFRVAVTFCPCNGHTFCHRSNTVLNKEPLLTEDPCTHGRGTPVEDTSHGCAPAPTPESDFSKWTGEMPGRNLAIIFSLILCIALAMIIHELGHLFAARRCGVPASEFGLGLGPRLVSFPVGTITFCLRAIPVASFVRLDGTALSQCSIPEQLFVHLGGIIFNFSIALIAQGTIVGWINLLLGLANLLPLYKHDGWKCGVVIMRAILRRKSKPVEWVFTFSGGLASLIIVITLAQFLGLR